MKYRTFAFTDVIYKMLSPKRASIDTEIELIKERINNNSPCMISRFGSTELQTLWYIRFFPLSLIFRKRVFHNIQNASGFFPVTQKNLRRFYCLYKADVKEMDLLVSWRLEEFFFKDWIKGKPQVQKSTLDQFYDQSNPWTSALKGKKVLVVHPFAETIQDQYLHHRSELFSNPKILPEFYSLQVVKAVQSIAGNPVDFRDWFEALDSMKTEIDKHDYDIALLGCGAYAMPLAAHIKRQGKKAIHMGGILQFLFGIKGVRYEENPATKAIINDSFVYPQETDKPKNAQMVEGGCYWGK